MVPLVAVIPLLVAAMTGLRKAGDVDHMALADRAVHITVKLAAAAFELNVIELHSEAFRTNPVHPQIIVDIDIAETGAVALTLNGSRTGTDGLAAQLPGLPWLLAKAAPVLIVPAAASPAVIADRERDGRVRKAERDARKSCLCGVGRPVC
jgi:hypothetical protein